MSRERERCDHCKKWVRREGALVIPNHIPEYYQDGRIGICEKCVGMNYSKEYMEKWFNNFIKNKDQQWFNNFIQ